MAISEGRCSAEFFSVKRNAELKQSNGRQRQEVEYLWNRDVMTGSNSKKMAHPRLLKGEASLAALSDADGKELRKVRGAKTRLGIKFRAWTNNGFHFIKEKWSNRNLQQVCVEWPGLGYEYLEKQAWITTSSCLSLIPLCQSSWGSSPWSSNVSTKAFSLCSISCSSPLGYAASRSILFFP